MKLLYFGSPEISARLLDRLIRDREHQICAVISNPDRPRGRSSKPVPTPVSLRAMEEGLPLFRFPSLKGEAGEQALRELRTFEADLGVVFAYGSIIPAAIFTMPGLGSVNLHGSLLPALRGASPVQSAILNGFTETGWTLQRLSERMDAGDILSTVKIAIDENETAGELLERMMPYGIQLVIDSLHSIDDLLSSARPQDELQATYCSKLRPEDAFISWSDSSLTIHNKIRGMNPAPLARTITEKGDLILLHRSALMLQDSIVGLLDSHDSEQSPGTVRVVRHSGKKRLLIRTGSGFLEILELQLSGRRHMQAHEFLNGSAVTDGSRFGAAPEAERIV
jgi:methionyl-tRNA formyltransferase